MLNIDSLCLNALSLGSAIRQDVHSHYSYSKCCQESKQTGSKWNVDWKWGNKNFLCLQVTWSFVFRTSVSVFRTSKKPTDNTIYNNKIWEWVFDTMVKTPLHSVLDCLGSSSGSASDSSFQLTCTWEAAGGWLKCLVPSCLLGRTRLGGIWRVSQRVEDLLVSLFLSNKIKKNKE